MLNQNPQTKRTLQMLCNEHRKTGKELEKKIAKLRAEGKDPTQPQKPDPVHNFEHRSSSHPIAGPSRIIPSPPPNQHLTDSQGTVDESFMLLAGQRVRPAFDIVPLSSHSTP